MHHGQGKDHQSQPITKQIHVETPIRFRHQDMPKESDQECYTFVSNLDPQHNKIPPILTTMSLPTFAGYLSLSSSQSWKLSQRLDVLSSPSSLTGSTSLSLGTSDDQMIYPQIKYTELFISSNKEVTFNSFPCVSSTTPLFSLPLAFKIKFGIIQLSLSLCRVSAVPLRFSIISLSKFHQRPSVKFDESYGIIHPNRSSRPSPFKSTGSG